MNPGDFEILHQETDTQARLGRLMTAHGPVNTPVFMPVGTLATVKTQSPRDLVNEGFEIILGNTYHLFLRPGTEIIEQHGGLHRFMGWERAILTDSGGFQVWSLGRLNRITDDGVEFQSHLDGSRLFLGPREAMAIQRALASDIAMVFDECIPYPAEKEYASRSIQRTIDWAKICRDQPRAPNQLVFGIGQGGEFADLREECARALAELDFDGYAIGGCAVGEPAEQIIEGVRRSIPFLPEAKPRYLMGVGELDQMVESIAAGVDMFDCVIPTRYARNGTAFTRGGRLAVKNAAFKNDLRPLEQDCNCYTCQHFTRAYLRHLFHCGEVLGLHLLTTHNLHRFNQTLAEIRVAISENRLKDFALQFGNRYQARQAADPDSV